SERDALMAILQHPTDVGAELVERATRVRFVNATLSVVRDAVSASLDHVEADGWLQHVSDQVPAPFATLVQQLGVAPIPQRPDLLAQYCRGVVTSLIDRDLLREKAEVVGAMQRARSEGDDARWGELSRQSVALEAERRKLRNE
ncbi:MAG TPA: DNA primase, partial [Pseudolysinimonas sp.]|nr:DNA primase [Pseudolysinimonas sp.]